MSVTQFDEEAIFNIARKIDSPDLRSEYLEQVCGDNPGLLLRIRSLLEAHDERESFLEAPPAAVDATESVVPITEAPGTVIGKYKLMEQIGEGGMGVVYVAEQQRPMRRKVALKIIKPGMDTKDVISRFEVERQALALMDHPNIARVLDASTTESGRAYFVMELVRGISITEYCDLNKLNTRERLELFVSVCQAVQHAHQKGIIHRDIKPSNVLITEHDGTPVVKVIDFGVAKAINQRLTEHTLYTFFRQMVGTPLYMSPEQAELSGLDVDTRADIYSLGVLLYELLTGTTPFDKDRFGEAAYDEIRRIIREEEPPKPSTKISTLGNTAGTISAHRRTDARKLCQTLRGELDWIIMRALEKDRNRRYATAAGFGVDVQRYLDDEPVQARPSSVSYRVSKFVRRNSGLVTAVVTVITVLGIGIIGTTTGWISAYTAQQEAKTSEEQALQAKLVAETAMDEAKRQSEIANNQTEELQKVTFEYLFYDAVLNGSVNTRILQSAGPSLKEEQRFALKGLEAFYAGEHVQAVRLFKRSDTTIATLSMMAWSQIALGDDVGCVNSIATLRSMTPESAEDHLMLGQLYAWVRPEFALRQIEVAIKKKGTPSAISQVAYALALVNYANIEDRPDLALNAAEMIAAAKKLYPNNQFILDRSIHINFATSVIMDGTGDKDSAQRYRQLAKDAASEPLATGAHVPTMLVWDEKYAEAMSILEKQVETPNYQNTCYAAVAMLAGADYPARAKRVMKEHSPGFYREIGLMLLDAQDPIQRQAVKERALEIFKTNRGSDARVMAIEALLMARVPVAEVSGLAAQYRGDSIDLIAPLGVIEYVAELTERDYAVTPSARPPGEHRLIDFIRALCLYSDEDWPEAARLLEKTRRSLLSGHEQLWATYLLQRIEAATKN